MVQILERVQAHYESREMPFGKVYEWHPSAFALECEEARYWQANLLFERVSEQAGHPLHPE